MRIPLLASLLSAGVLTGPACNAPEPSADLLVPSESQLQLRAYQSRSFDVPDRSLAMRAVISALQDIGFIIERANEPLGLVTAARFVEPNFSSVVEATVIVREEQSGGMLIRINAIYNNRPIEDPESYANFFAALGRSLLLTRDS